MRTSYLLESLVVDQPPRIRHRQQVEGDWEPVLALRRVIRVDQVEADEYLGAGGSRAVRQLRQAQGESGDGVGGPDDLTVSVGSGGT